MAESWKSCNVCPRIAARFFLNRNSPARGFFFAPHFWHPCRVNKLYEGFRDDDGILRVTVDGKPLDPRTDIRNHSPTGLEVGYLGSGCAQTALALLADALGDDEQA